MSSFSDLAALEAAFGGMPIEATAKLLEKMDCERTFHSFIKEAWKVIVPAKFVDNWHIQVMAEHLEAVAFGEIRHLLITVPPRHSKTLITSVLFPAWIWAQQKDQEYPLLGAGTRFLNVTYAQNKSDEDAIRARNLLTSTWYQGHWGNRVQLSSDLNKIEHFANTAGGERVSGSWGSSILGRGGDIKIIDDPHKVDEAESDIVRESVLRAYEEALQTRVTDPKLSAEILIMQRLHEADLANKWMESHRDVVTLMLPEEYEPRYHCITWLPSQDRDDPAEVPFFSDPRTEVGELLWPEQWPTEELDKFRILPYVWAGQFQQVPVPRGGGVIQRDWWQEWPPEGWSEQQAKQYPPMEYVVAGLDTAFTEKRENDYCALTIWGVWRDVGVSTKRQPYTGLYNEIPPINEDERAKVMLMYAWQKRLKLHGEGEPIDLQTCQVFCPSCNTSEGHSHKLSCKDYFEARSKYWGLVEWTAYLCNRFNVDVLLIEDSAAGKPVSDELRRLNMDTRWHVEMVQAKGDKISRAHSVVPLFANGRVWAPITREWAQPVIDQLVSLGKTRHDDLADSASMSLMHLRQHRLAVLPHEEDASYAAEWRSSRKTRGSVAARYEG